MAAVSCGARPGRQGNRITLAAGTDRNVQVRASTRGAGGSRARACSWITPSIAKNARGRPELASERLPLFRTVRHELIDHVIQFLARTINSLRRTIHRDGAVAV